MPSCGEGMKLVGRLRPRSASEAARTRVGASEDSARDHKTEASAACLCVSPCVVEVGRVDARGMRESSGMTCGFPAAAINGQRDWTVGQWVVGMLSVAQWVQCVAQALRYLCTVSVPGLLDRPRLPWADERFN